MNLEEIFSFSDCFKEFTSSKLSKSFINSLPQLGLYGMMMKEKFKGLKVKCVIFSKDGAWVFDPEHALDTIIAFYKDQNVVQIPPWILYFKRMNLDFIYYSKPFNIARFLG